MILDGATVDRDVALSADVCVVGSGAGGGVVAQELAAAGRTVVVVEQGPYVTAAQFTQREEEMLPLLYADQTREANSDAAIIVPRGRVVGGSTVPSSCVCARTPARLLNHWAQVTGVESLRVESLAPFFQRVEATAHVQALAPVDINRNGAMLKLGADRLGFRNFQPMHNRVDCLGCGFCALGCSYDRKGDALTVHLRAASRNGAVIVPGCRVERIEVRQGRVTGITGRFHETPRPCMLTVRAPSVVLAAGALGSPALWLRSQLPNTGKQVGRNLHLHPQVAVAAVYPDEIAGWRGIPQAVIVDHFLELGRALIGGYTLAPFFAHPMTMASLLPGFGLGWRRLLGDYARMAMAVVVLHDRTAGQVHLGSDGEPAIAYQLNEDDRVDLLDGMRRLADIFFASGAQRVVLPYTDVVELTRRGDYRAIDERSPRANDPPLFAFHPQGTLRMGANPKRSVVNGWGESHEVRGLFVADASVFPTSTAVPPQLSVMAFAARTAAYLGGRRP